MARSTDDDKLEGIKDLLKTSSEYSRSSVLYGRSGTGKTTLASTWPKPMLYLDVRDRGIDSISDVEDIDLKEIESFEELEDTLFWLIRHPKSYSTVVVDTVSQLQELLVEEVGQRRRKKKSSTAKRAGDWGTLRQQDWGEIAARLKSVIIDFRNLPMEVVFIAQDRMFKGTDEDDDDSDAEAISPEVGPQLMPSVAKVLNAAVPVIGNTFIRMHWEKKESSKGKITRVPVKDYCLRVGPSSTYVTKIRKPKRVTAPEFIVDPSYEDILEIIEGEYSEDD
jgi:AAA domain